METKQCAQDRHFEVLSVLLYTRIDLIKEKAAKGSSKITEVSKLESRERRYWKVPNFGGILGNEQNKPSTRDQSLSVLSFDAERAILPEGWIAIAVTAS